jgi:hypothetical protein
MGEDTKFLCFLLVVYPVFTNPVFTNLETPQTLSFRGFMDICYVYMIDYV